MNKTLKIVLIILGVLAGIGLVIRVALFFVAQKVISNNYDEAKAKIFQLQAQKAQMQAKTYFIFNEDDTCVTLSELGLTANGFKGRVEYNKNSETYTLYLSNSEYYYDGVTDTYKKPELINSQIDVSKYDVCPDRSDNDDDNKTPEFTNETTENIILNGKNHKITFKYYEKQDTNYPDYEITNAKIYLDNKEIKDADLIMNYKELDSLYRGTTKIETISYKGKDKEYLILYIDNAHPMYEGGFSIYIINENGTLLKKLHGATGIVSLENCPRNYIGVGNQFYVTKDKLYYLETNMDKILGKPNNEKDFIEYEIIIDNNAVTRNKIASYNGLAAGSVGEIWQ